MPLFSIRAAIQTAGYFISLGNVVLEIIAFSGFSKSNEPCRGDSKCFTFSFKPRFFIGYFVNMF